MEEYQFEEVVTQPLKAGRLVWQDDNSTIQEYVLYEGISTTIGREKGNHILLPNPIVSKNHAIIQWKKGAFIITDRGSSNGTFVNRRLIHEPTPLSDTDNIEIGDYKIKFYVMEDQEIEYPGVQAEIDQRLNTEKLESEVTTQRTVPQPYPRGEAERKTPPSPAESKPAQQSQRSSAPPNPVWLAAEELDEIAIELSDEELAVAEALQESDDGSSQPEETAAQAPFLSEDDFESLIKAVEAKQATLNQAIPEPEPSQARRQAVAKEEEWVEETLLSEEEEEAQSEGEETLIVEIEDKPLDKPITGQPEKAPSGPRGKAQATEQLTPTAAPGKDQEIEAAYAGLMESLRAAQINAQILGDKGRALQQKVSASVRQLQAILVEMKELEINASEVQLDDLLASLPDTPYDVRLLMNLANNSGLLSRILKDSLALSEMINKTKQELEDALQHYVD